jgi:hypothetical protein
LYSDGCAWCREDEVIAVEFVEEIAAIEEDRLDPHDCELASHEPIWAAPPASMEKP